MRPYFGKNTLDAFGDLLLTPFEAASVKVPSGPPKCEVCSEPVGSCEHSPPERTNYGK